MPLLRDWQVAMSEQLESNLYHATMYPTATFTYVSRLDPLLALVDALQLTASPPAPPLLVQNSHQPAPQPQ